MARGENPQDICSVCGQHNFRACLCPWDKPFDEWPRGTWTTKRLRDMVADGSPEGRKKAK